MIDKAPNQLKLSYALWTRDAVKLLILQRFKYEMPIRTVGEYLKRWGFTPQKPAMSFFTSIHPPGFHTHSPRHGVLNWFVNVS
jgi:hypothetical protein